MAVWKPENFVLTDVGREILNLVTLGTGSINITRVSSSSQVVTAPIITKLKSSVAAGFSEKQQLQLVRTEPSPTGISLFVRLSNVGLLTAYNLRQIGVFVTHPSFTGEQLYMLAQSEDITFDVIPKDTDNAVSLDLSLSIVYGDGAFTVTMTEASVVSAYCHIKYSDVNPTKNSDILSTPSDYIGFYSGELPSPPIDYTKYSWFKSKGIDGASAFDAAVTGGYTRTQSQFYEDLASLEDLRVLLTNL